MNPALDVTTPEPLEKDSKLWSLSNVLLTPHMRFVSDCLCDWTLKRTCF